MATFQIDRIARPVAFGAVCRMPASAFASAMRTSVVTQLPVITLSASSTIM